MKSNILGIILGCSLLSGLWLSKPLQAQEESGSNISYFSFSYKTGFAIPLSPFSEGYNASRITLNHHQFGLGFMFTEHIGLMTKTLFNTYKEPKNTSLTAFETRQNQFALLGVVNIGSLAGLKQINPKLDLLLQLGGQLSLFKVMTNPDDVSTERNGGILASLSPEYALSDMFRLMLDIGYEYNIRQDRTWDGKTNATADRRGSKVVVAVGLGIVF